MPGGAGQQPGQGHLCPGGGVPAGDLGQRGSLPGGQAHARWEPRGVQAEVEQSRAEREVGNERDAVPLAGGQDIFAATGDPAEPQVADQPTRP
jgi:hypothetical protein